MNSGAALRFAALVAVVTCGPASGAPTRTGRAALRSLAGVYEHSFENALVDGERYRSENILEIVPTAPRAAYFRTHIEFSNGHQCDLSGIAYARAGELVYRGPIKDTTFGLPRCILHIARSGDLIHLRDNATCQSYCGARGSFENDTLPAASRRPIRYMARLKASREFRDASAEAAVGEKRQVLRGTPPFQNPW